MYCVDNGVVFVTSPSFTRDEGRRLENMVFTELRRRYSLRYSIIMRTRKECDFIVVRNSVPQLAIQVCYALTARKPEKEVDGLLDALSFFKMGHGLILTYNQHDKFSVGDKTIEALPVSEYFKD